MPSSTRCSRALNKEWGTLDFLVHAIAFSDAKELKGRYVDTTPRQLPQKPRYFLLFLHRRGAPRGRH